MPLHEDPGVSYHPLEPRLFVDQLVMANSNEIIRALQYDLSEGNPPVTAGFQFKMTSNVENVPISPRHHETRRLMFYFYDVCH